MTFIYESHGLLVGDLQSLGVPCFFLADTRRQGLADEQLDLQYCTERESQEPGVLDYLWEMGELRRQEKDT